MKLSDCQSDLLRQLAETPFVDRVELAALSGWSPSGVYRQMAKLQQCGLIEHLTHATPLIPTTRRYCLSAEGLRQLAEGGGGKVARQLRSWPVSQEWRRLILQRLAAAAVLYRLTTAIGESQHPLRFRWFRAQAMDAVIELPDGRSLALVRIGRTTDRTALAKRLRRLDDALGVGAALIILPDEIRLRHARRIVAGSTMMAFLAVEREVVNTDAEFPLWRIASGKSRFKLKEALSYALATPNLVIEQPLSRVSMPDSLTERRPVSLTAAEQRALDLIGDWPWLRLAHLADLLDCGQRRTSQILNRLATSNFICRQDAGGRPRLALSDAGITYVARRDRAAVGIAKQRWSVTLVEPDSPMHWRIVNGARSRQLLRHLEHTESVYWFIAQVARQAAGSESAVKQLDPPHRASRYFRFEGAVRSVHPDAYFELLTSKTRQAFFLEYERRADRPATMRDRLAPYLRYYSTRRPLEDHGVIPSVLVVFEDELAADHFLNIARDELELAHVHLPLFVSCKADINRWGPLDSIWRTADGRERVGLR